jgi:hypothetical protein
VTLHLNCDDVEREEMNVEMADILDWIVTVYMPEFDAIDQYFRKHQQKLWIRDQ